VETIGDAYSCASGVPVRNPNHAAELADMALALRVAVTEFKVCTTLQCMKAHSHNSVYSGNHPCLPEDLFLLHTLVISFISSGIGRRRVGQYSCMPYDTIGEFNVD